MTSKIKPPKDHVEYAVAKIDLLAAHFAHHISQCPECKWPKRTDYVCDNGCDE